MYTRLLLSISAVILSLAGATLLFFPDDIAQMILPTDNGISVLLLQIIGAAYLGFAMLNWMTRNNPIGGIYNRPVMVANTTHHVIVSISLVKVLISTPDSSYVLWGVAIVYVLFSITFGQLFFRHPE